MALPNIEALEYILCVDQDVVWIEQPMTKTESASEDKRRAGRRQPVLWKSVLTVGRHRFDCIMYNISLQGARIKLDLPLEKGAEVNLNIRGEWDVKGHVAWQRDGFMGLKFDMDKAEIKVLFGEIAERL